VRPVRNQLAVAAIAGCPIFPASNQWNQPVDRLPVHANSEAIVRSIGASGTVHPDFGSGLYEGRPIGIPYTVVARDQPRSPVRFEYAGESDKGPYPIPPSPPVEGGSDRHILIVQRGTCRLYELFAADGAGGPSASENRPGGDAPGASGPGWSAGSGAIFDLRSNRLRPRGWTSADAAGLPILPGLARYDEVAKGAIRHALRLKRGVRISGFPRQARVIARALQRYGMLVADNGSNWYVSGAPHPRWDNDQLRALKTLKGSDFEVVDTSKLKRPR
jgi:hypothetical protein